MNSRVVSVSTHSLEKWACCTHQINCDLLLHDSATFDCDCDYDEGGADTIRTLAIAAHKTVRRN